MNVPHLEEVARNLGDIGVMLGRVQSLQESEDKSGVLAWLALTKSQVVNMLRHLSEAESYVARGLADKETGKGGRVE